ncbi:MAG TPA: hypothetical protein DD671_13120 [Balneolaceae bacterium]|nr:hypothetical protein [Balneolaceae bacterium]
MNPSREFQRKRKVRNLVRISLLLIIAPVLYLGLWISISMDDSLTYFEQVQQLMSYFPESIRNPFGTTITFLGMSFISAVFAFYAFLKSDSKKQQSFSLALSAIAAILTLWFGFTLL